MKAHTKYSMPPPRPPAARRAVSETNPRPLKVVGAPPVAALAQALPVIKQSASPAAGWATAASPLFTALILLFVSGLPTAEGASLARFYATEAGGRSWEAYAARTSPVVPLPTCLYAKCASTLHRAVRPGSQGQAP